jgi:hypothetical protein
MDLNTEILSQAISEHYHGKKVTHGGENSILIDGKKFTFREGLVLSPVVSYRFTHLKEFLLHLRIEGVLLLSDASIECIATRYRHLLNKNNSK